MMLVQSEVKKNMSMSHVTDLKATLARKVKVFQSWHV